MSEGRTRIMAGDVALLFVYGTLRPTLATGKPGLLVHDLPLVGPATVAGLLLDLRDYPGLIAGEGIVHGDLLRVDDAERLAALDAYEECGGPAPLFRRERAVATRPDGTTVEAWVYRYVRPTTGPLIAGGDFAAHVARR